MIKIKKIETVVIKKEEYVPSSMISLLDMVGIGFHDVSFDICLRVDDDNKSVDIVSIKDEQIEKIANVTGVENLSTEQLEVCFDELYKGLLENKDEIVPMYKEIYTTILERSALLELTKML